MEKRSHFSSPHSPAVSQHCLENVQRGKKIRTHLCFQRPIPDLIHQKHVRDEAQVEAVGTLFAQEQHEARRVRPKLFQFPGSGKGGAEIAGEGERRRVVNGTSTCSSPTSTSDRNRGYSGLLQPNAHRVGRGLRATAYYRSLPPGPYAQTRAPIFAPEFCDTLLASVLPALGRVASKLAQKFVADDLPAVANLRHVARVDSSKIDRSIG